MDLLEPNATTFLPLRRAAHLLGVPLAWLRAQVEAGHLPHLRTGRTIRVNLEAVRETLLDRAEQEAADSPVEAAGAIPAGLDDPHHGGA